MEGLNGEEVAEAIANKASTVSRCHVVQGGRSTFAIVAVLEFLFSVRSSKVPYAVIDAPITGSVESHFAKNVSLSSVSKWMRYLNGAIVEAFEGQVTKEWDIDVR